MRHVQIQLRKMNVHYLLIVSTVAVMFMALVMLPQNSHAAATDNLKQIGTIALAKGVVTARSSVRELTALAKGSPVYLSDIIETASRSFTVIEFNDAGKVTLRPESRFDLNEYDDTAGQEKESFELIKGGLRAVTGAIGKQRPDSVSFTARNTTIGIRGTTFIIKLCKVGVEGCAMYDGDKLDDIEADKKFIDIFVVDRSGGSKKKVTRQQLQDLLNGVYVSVVEGAIRVNTDEWYVDMRAGDKCVVDYEENSQAESQDDVECFFQGQGLEDVDVFLGDESGDITEFNLFDGSEIYVGNEICEIN